MESEGSKFDQKGLKGSRHYYSRPPMSYSHPRHLMNLINMMDGIYRLSDETQWSHCQINFLICLFQGEDPYPWPMFSRYPPPQCYTLDQTKIHDSSQGEVCR